jgi:hypothetical protein
LKEDLKKDEIHFVIGRLSDFDMQDQKYKQWTMVREIQVKLATDDPNGEWVDTDDLNNKGPDGKQNDLHYTRDGYKLLGERFAEKAIALIKKSVGTKSGETVACFHQASIADLKKNQITAAMQ